MNLEHYNIIRSVQELLDNKYPEIIYEKRTTPHTHIFISNKVSLTSKYYKEDGYISCNKWNLRSVVKNLLNNEAP